MIQSYFDSLNKKEKFNYIELNEAIIFRKRFLLLKNKTLEVQTALRGYLSRENQQKEVEEKIII